MGSNPILGKNITVAFTYVDTTMRGKYQALCMYVMSWSALLHILGKLDISQAML